MRLVVTDDEGEENGVLTGLEQYELGSKLGAAIVVAWIYETIEGIKRGEANDG